MMESFTVEHLKMILFCCCFLSNVSQSTYSFILYSVMHCAGWEDRGRGAKPH